MLPNNNKTGKSPQTLPICIFVLCMIVLGRSLLSSTSNIVANDLQTRCTTDRNYFNCNVPLSNQTTPDVPHAKDALSDINAMRAYIRQQQPGIEAYYQQQDKLEAFVRNQFHRKPSVLQLGGNNGWFADPLFPIIMAHEWPAIIIEALPQQFAKLVSNYGKKYDGCLWNGLQLINMAVVDEKKDVSMTYRDTSDWQRGGGSVLWHHDESGWKTMTVPGDTLAGILSQVDNSVIDLIQIDIEGLDEVLLQQVDLIMDDSTIHPYMVCVETCKEYCPKFFSKHGFEVFQAPGQHCGIRDFLK